MLICHARRRAAVRAHVDEHLGSPTPTHEADNRKVISREVTSPAAHPNLVLFTPRTDWSACLCAAHPLGTLASAALRVFAWRGIGVLRSWRQLLESPRVSVRVAEGNERAPRLNVHVTGLHTAFDQFPPRRLDIRHDNLDAFL